MNDDGPAIYSALYDERTKDMRDGAREYLTQRTEDLAIKLAGWTEELLAKAYIKGVTDGFAQGVAAECKRQKDAADSTQERP